MKSKDLASHIAKAVASRRFVAGMSQSELARRAGVTRQAIAMIENGDISPSLRTLEALASALEVRAAELMP